MAREEYVAPIFGSDGFHCPHCQTYAHQTWFSAYYYLEGTGFRGQIGDIKLTVCQRCGHYSIWLKDKMLFPLSSIAPLPEDDMPEDSKKDYNEARSIVNLSPRSACALLRQSLQKLMVSLGEKGDLNASIGNLVKRGLPEGVQQALDCVRVIGNNAVHPLELNLEDDTETALALFDMLNLIVNYMITRPKQVNALYDKLPKGAKDAISKRDK